MRYVLKIFKFLQCLLVRIGFSDWLVCCYGVSTEWGDDHEKYEGNLPEVYTAVRRKTNFEKQFPLAKP